MVWHKTNQNLNSAIILGWLLIYDWCQFKRIFQVMIFFSDLTMVKVLKGKFWSPWLKLIHFNQHGVMIKLTLL